MTINHYFCDTIN